LLHRVLSASPNRPAVPDARYFLHLKLHRLEGFFTFGEDNLLRDHTRQEMSVQVVVSGSEKPL